MGLELNEIYLGDCLELMKNIDDKSVDLTVTSPPYDNLREYNGNSAFDFKGVAKELFRVTKDGGVVVWVVADATIKGSETGTSFKQALYFKEIGFNLHDTMIYLKESQPRQKVRYEQQFEYMFVFSKGKPKAFNPMKIPCKNAGKKTSRNCRDGGKDILIKSANIIANEKIKSNIWKYTNANTKNKTIHPAVFPEQLAIDHIISWSNKGDIILDCFLGSGTTAIAAINTKRNFIGIEIDEGYYKITKERIEKHKEDKC